jgi:hypothetical protein
MLKCVSLCGLPPQARLQRLAKIVLANERTWHNYNVRLCCGYTKLEILTCLKPYLLRGESSKIVEQLEPYITEMHKIQSRRVTAWNSQGEDCYVLKRDYIKPTARETKSQRYRLFLSNYVFVVSPDIVGYAGDLYPVCGLPVRMTCDYVRDVVRYCVVKPRHPEIHSSVPIKAEEAADWPCVARPLITAAIAAWIKYLVSIADKLPKETGHG